MAFDLAEALRGTVERETGIDKGKEKIEYLNYQHIHGSASNFYSLDGIDELAANIELIGLQQPIRVQKIPGSEKFVQMYRVVSGHRRLAAWRKLDLNDPEGKYRQIPAIVEPDREEPEALQKLRLIYANSDTRKMTGHDLQMQASRIKDLLQQLKDNGYEFKGRMRDQVAQICGVSKSKLSRLDAIKNNLHPGIYNAYYQTAEISESSAYEISKLPEKEQANICRKLSKGWRPTTEKLLEYVSDRTAAKEEAKREAEAELQKAQDTIRKEYDLLNTNISDEERPEPAPQKDVPNVGTNTEMGKFVRMCYDYFYMNTRNPIWQKGTPPRDGLYYCRISIEGTQLDQILDYQEKSGITGQPAWRMKHGYELHENCEILAWWPLPEGDPA